MAWPMVSMPSGCWMTYQARAPAMPSKMAQKPRSPKMFLGRPAWSPQRLVRNTARMAPMAMSTPYQCRAKSPMFSRMGCTQAS